MDHVFVSGDSKRCDEGPTCGQTCIVGPVDKSRKHRKTVRHFHEPGDFHELTFSCYRRLPLLTNDDWRQRLCRCIDTACQKTAVELVGFVLMPEHVHLLVFPLTDSETGNIPDYLSQLKNPFSRDIKKLLKVAKSPLLKRLTVRERPGKTCFRFWQEGAGFDRNLFTPAAIQASLDYIHNNPVQRANCHTSTGSARKHSIEANLDNARHAIEPATWQPPFSIIPAAPPIAFDPLSNGKSLCRSHWLKVRRRSNILQAPLCRTFIQCHPAAGQVRRVIPALVTREVFCRLATDFSAVASQVATS